MRYSWSHFGREAEYIVALYLKSIGWTDVRMSPGSRGPADVTAICQKATWFIQVKASSGVPRLRSREIGRLLKMAGESSGSAIVATFQPLGTGAYSTGNFDINFYEIDSWKALDPTLYPAKGDSAALKSASRSP